MHQYWGNFHHTVCHQSLIASTTDCKLQIHSAESNVHALSWGEIKQQTQPHRATQVVTGEQRNKMLLQWSKQPIWLSGHRWSLLWCHWVLIQLFIYHLGTGSCYVTFQSLWREAQLKRFCPEVLVLLTLTRNMSQADIYITVSESKVAACQETLQIQFSLQREGAHNFQPL